MSQSHTRTRIHTRALMSSYNHRHSLPNRTYDVQTQPLPDVNDYAEIAMQCEQMLVFLKKEYKSSNELLAKLVERHGNTYDTRMRFDIAAHIEKCSHSQRQIETTISIYTNKLNDAEYSLKMLQ